MYTVFVVLLTVFVVMNYHTIMGILQFIAIKFIIFIVSLFTKDESKKEAQEEAKESPKSIRDNVFFQLLMVLLSFVIFLACIWLSFTLLAELVRWYKGV